MLKLALILLVIFCPLAIDLYLPAIPQMAEDLNASITSIQSSITLFMLCVGLMQLFFGPLSDRFGRKKIALVGVGTYILGSLMAAQADSVMLLLLARFIQGAGAAATFVSTFALVRDNYSANKSGQVISYLNGIVCFIPALAPILGAWLTLTFNWQSNFYFLALFGIIGFTVLFWVLPSSKKGNIQHSAPDRISYYQILTNTQFAINATICMLAMAAILAFVAQAPNYLMTIKGLDEKTFTFWFSLNAVVSICASFLAPQLIKRSTKLALSIGLSLMLISGGLVILVTSYSQQIPYFMTAIFIGSIGFALALGAAAGNALAPFAKNAGKASALLGLMQMSGAGLLVSLSQYLPIEIPGIITLHLIAVAPFLALILSQTKQPISAQT